MISIIYKKLIKNKNIKTEHTTQKETSYWIDDTITLSKHVGLSMLTSNDKLFEESRKKGFISRHNNIYFTEAALEGCRRLEAESIFKPGQKWNSNYSKTECEKLDIKSHEGKEYTIGSIRASLSKRVYYTTNKETGDAIIFNVGKHHEKTEKTKAQATDTIKTFW